MIKKKNTDDLLKELKKQSTDINEYFEKNPESFIQVNLNTFWNGLLNKSKKTKADIVFDSELSYVYFYEILQGKKVPAKDKIIRIILSMELGLEDCQQALTFCNHSQLYPRIKRDSVIIYAIEHNYSVSQTQELLAGAGESELK